MRNIDEIFYDVDEHCKEPFKQIDFIGNEGRDFLAEDEAASALE